MAKAAKKHDPYLAHLWRELTQSKFLKLEGVADRMEAPATIQGKFAAAARRAMRAALGVPGKPAKPRPAGRKPAAKKKVGHMAAAPKAKAGGKRRAGPRG